VKIPLQLLKVKPPFLLLLFPDSGVGAGIDSYYEYLLKAYVLLGDDSFLERFNTVSEHLAQVCAFCKTN